jgi:arsenate reductase
MTMAKIVVYRNRRARRAVRKKAGIKARDLLRTKEDLYRKLKLADRDLSESEIIDLMVEHPDLIQRPIVEKGNRAILARPPERLKEIL